MRRVNNWLAADTKPALHAHNVGTVLLDGLLHGLAHCAGGSQGVPLGVINDLQHHPTQPFKCVPLLLKTKLPFKVAVLAFRAARASRCNTAALPLVDLGNCLPRASEAAVSPLLEGCAAPVLQVHVLVQMQPCPCKHAPHGT